MDFKNGKELLALCEKEHLPISAVMKKREEFLKEMTEDQVDAKMRKALDIMKNSVHESLEKPVRSIGGLIGGEAKMMKEYRESGKNLCGEMLSRAMSYAMGVLEVNATMGLIVAAPTAGSSGVVPGALLA